MKKTLATFALLCMVCMSSWAQETGRDAFFSCRKSTEKVSFGIRGGLNVSQLATVADKDVAREGRHVGFHAGVSLEVPIVESLGFETGLYFVQKAVKEKSDGLLGLGDTEAKGTPCYVEIPLLASYRHTFRKVQLQVSTGPYLAYGVCGKLKQETTNNYGIVTSKQDADWFGGEDDRESLRMKRFDMGWHLGAGLKFKGSIYLGYSYEAGLVNCSRSEDAKVKTRSHAISLGFAF